MKIYTEINYKWLDGQLIKTDSKSFEYEGEVTFCGGGGGGGGGTLGSIVNKIVKTVTQPASVTPKMEVPSIDFSVGDIGLGELSNIGSTIEQTLTDPIGTTTTGLENLGENLGSVVGAVSEPLLEGMSTGGEVIGANVNTALNMGNENLATGLQGIGMNQGVATTLGDIGENINTNMKPIVEEGWRWTDAAGAEINRWVDYAGEKAQELTDFVHQPKKGTPDVELDKLAAFKANKLKKIRGDLGTNVAKSRARSSLRIG